MTLWNLLGLLLMFGGWPACYWFLTKVFTPVAPDAEAGQSRASTDLD